MGPAFEWTVTGPDSAPPDEARTRYPLPGGTLRNSRPPSESARCVYSVVPFARSSDMRAFGDKPVT